MTVVFGRKIATTDNLNGSGTELDSPEFRPYPRPKVWRFRLPAVVTLLNLATCNPDSRLPLKIVSEETALQQNESVLSSVRQHPDTNVV